MSVLLHTGHGTTALVTNEDEATTTTTEPALINGNHNIIHSSTLLL